SLHDRRINNDAFGLVNQVLGNVVRNIHNFLEDDATIFQAIGFLLILTCSGQRTRQDDERGQKCCEFLHDALLHGIDSRLNGPGLGACKSSNPVSAARRLNAGACLEEVLRNVSTILVAVTIFQRGRAVGKKRLWRWTSEFALALAAFVVSLAPFHVQKHLGGQTGLPRKAKITGPYNFFDAANPTLPNEKFQFKRKKKFTVRRKKPLMS